MEPTLEALQPVLMSRDVRRSIRFYEMIGFTLAGLDDADEPRYARVTRDNIEIHLQWHDAAEWDYPNDRPTYRFLVRDVDGLYEEFRGTGEDLDMKPVGDTSWGTREFHLRDPDLNGLQFYRPR